MPEQMKPTKERKCFVRSTPQDSSSPLWRKRQVKEIRARFERFLREAQTEREFLFLSIVLESWEQDQEKKRPANTAGLFLVAGTSANHSDISGISPSEIRQ